MSNRIDAVENEEQIDLNHKRKAFIAFIVDESGSMGAGREATMRGMNEQIQMVRNKFKDAPGVEPIVTVVKFNEHVNALYVNKTLNELSEFTEETYTPNGGTAMYDAVGYVLNQLESAKGINDEDSSVLVVVVSDGEENSSKEHTSQMIADRIKSFNETKRWTVTYLGANQDLTVVQAKTNVYAGNTMSFNSSNNVTYAAAFRGHNRAMDTYMTNISSSVPTVLASLNFYGGEATSETESPEPTPTPPIQGIKP